MFIKPLNNNQIDFIERNIDESIGMTTINTTHFRIGLVDFPNSIPIDLLCEHFGNTKKLFLVYSTNKKIGAKATITISHNSNNLFSLSPLQPPIIEGDNPYRQNKYRFPISEKEFQFCCQASSLDLEIDEDNGIPPKKENWKEFVYLCKLLYQNVYDRNAFPETAAYLQEKKEELVKINDMRNNNK